MRGECGKLNLLKEKSLSHNHLQNGICYVDAVVKELNFILNIDQL